MAVDLSELTVNQQKYGPVGRNDMGINLGKPKHPDYAKLDKRLETFETWKEYFPVKKEALAEAGFTYTGTGDGCRCYHCGGGIRYWEEGDDPWVEHAKLYPNCDHVLLIKGVKFVDKHKEGADSTKDVPTEDAKAGSQTDGAIPISMEQFLKDVPACACREMGYRDPQISQAIDIYTQTTGKTNFKAENLLQIIMEIEDDGFDEVLERELLKNSAASSINSLEEEKRILEENERLKRMQLCPECKAAKACVIFLPCGHLMVCAQCAMGMTECSKCKKKVLATIKAYFGSDSD